MSEGKSPLDWEEGEQYYVEWTYIIITIKCINDKPKNLALS